MTDSIRSTQTAPANDRPGPASRRRVDVALPLHEKVDAAWRALRDANDPQFPRVMVRGNALVRMTERAELENLGVDSLRDELSRVAQFERASGQNLTPVDPPQDVAKTLLARDSAEYTGAPRVDRVVDVPVVGRSGDLVTRPGYHAEGDGGGGLYYRPAPGLENLDVPEPGSVESVDEVIDARNLLLDELLGDFGFSDEASRAHALGLLLLPFVREYIGDQPTPMHGVFAPTPGTGKGYLAQAALIPACGIVPMTPGAAQDDAEWRKAITSSLLAAVPAIVFDNLHGAMNSAALAAALTAGTWRDRILGHSQMATLPVRNVWVATANNPAVSDEHARRIAAPIFLDPGETRPADRPRDAFKHSDLHGWATENRPDLVRAALTLIRHWLDGPAEVVGGQFVRHDELYDRQSQPQHSRRTVGSFERWAGVVGGILEAADVRGFVQNLDRLNAEANEERIETTEFLAAWHGHEREPLEFKDVFALCQWGQPLHEYLPAELAAASGRPDWMHGKLKNWLRDHRDARDEGYRLTMQDGRPKRWYVRHG